MSNSEAKWPREKKLLMVEWKQVKENLTAAFKNTTTLNRAGFLSRYEIYLTSNSSHTPLCILETIHPSNMYRTDWNGAFLT